MTVTPRKSVRLPQLDLLRFVAALAVTLYHYVSSFPTADDIASSLLRPVAAVARYGYLGVDLFFIISGFVILWSAQNRTPTGFAISRTGRLFPSFWVAMLLSAACIASVPVLASQIGAPTPTASILLANATMVPGMLHSPLIDGVYWTLEIEIRFYAVIFALLLLRQLHRIQWWLYAWLIVSVIGQFIQLPWGLRFASLDPYGPLFTAGCFFYLIFANGSSIARWVGVAISAAASVVVCSAQQHNFITPDQYSIVIVPLTVVGFFALFVGIVLQRGWHLNLQLAASLGALTYPLYLIHGTIGRLLFEAMTPYVEVSLRVLIITMVALLMAYVMSVTVETYGRKLFETALKRVLGLFGIKSGLAEKPATT